MGFLDYARDIFTALAAHFAFVQSNECTFETDAQSCAPQVDKVKNPSERSFLK